MEHFALLSLVLAFSLPLGPTEETEKKPEAVVIGGEKDREEGVLSIEWRQRRRVKGRRTDVCVRHDTGRGTHRSKEKIKRVYYPHPLLAYRYPPI